MKTRTATKLLALALALVLLSQGLFSCAPERTVSKYKRPYVSPFNWTELVRTENGHLAYYEDGVVASRLGVDVSEHQGWIDWPSVANDGVEFALIRIGNRGATEGLLYPDDYFEANINGAREAGILVGVYFFSQAISEEEALEEAAFVLDHLAGRTLDYPVTFDHEYVTGLNGRTSNLTDEQVSSYARIFCDAIEAAGYETMLYGNKKDLNRLHYVLLSTHDLWFAEYDSAYPTIERDIAIWQYTSSGSVNGISTRTDLNIHFLPTERT